LRILFITAAVTGGVYDGVYGRREMLLLIPRAGDSLASLCADDVDDGDDVAADDNDDTTVGVASPETDRDRDSRRR